MTLSTTTSTGALLRAFQAAAVLTVATVAFQFVTAGELFPRGGPEELHAGGAIVLHVVSGLAAVLAVLLWRRGGPPARTAVLAVAVFVFTFVQAATGGRDHLAVHVPGAMLLTAGAAWLAVWAFTPACRR
jgi:hypothetical protein